MAIRRRSGEPRSPTAMFLRDSEIIFRQFEQCTEAGLVEFSTSICEGDNEETMQKVAALLLHYRLCSPDFVAHPLNGILPQDQIKDLPSFLYANPSEHPELFDATRKRFPEDSLGKNWQMLFHILGRDCPLIKLVSFLPWFQALNLSQQASLRQASTFACLSCIEGICVRIDKMEKNEETLSDNESFRRTKQLRRGMVDVVFANEGRTRDVCPLIRTECFKYLKRWTASTSFSPFATNEIWIPNGCKLAARAIKHDKCQLARKSAAELLRWMLHNPEIECADVMDFGELMKNTLQLLMAQDIVLRQAGIDAAIYLAEVAKKNDAHHEKIRAPILLALKDVEHKGIDLMWDNNDLVAIPAARFVDIHICDKKLQSKGPDAIQASINFLKKYEFMGLESKFIRVTKQFKFWTWDSVIEALKGDKAADIDYVNDVLTFALAVVKNGDNTELYTPTMVLRDSLSLFTNYHNAETHKVLFDIVCHTLSNSTKGRSQVDSSTLSKIGKRTRECLRSISYYKAMLISGHLFTLIDEWRACYKGLVENSLSRFEALATEPKVEPDLSQGNDEHVEAPSGADDQCSLLSLIARKYFISDLDVARFHAAQLKRCSTLGTKSNWFALETYYWLAMQHEDRIPDALKIMEANLKNECAHSRAMAFVSILSFTINFGEKIESPIITWEKAIVYFRKLVASYANDDGAIMPPVKKCTIVGLLFRRSKLNKDENVLCDLIPLIAKQVIANLHVPLCKDLAVDVLLLSRFQKYAYLAWDMVLSVKNLTQKDRGALQPGKLQDGYFWEVLIRTLKRIEKRRMGELVTDTIVKRITNRMSLYHPFDAALLRKLKCEFCNTHQSGVSPKSRPVSEPNWFRPMTHFFVKCKSTFILEVSATLSTLDCMEWWTDVKEFLVKLGNDPTNLSLRRMNPRVAAGMVSLSPSHAHGTPLSQISPVMARSHYGTSPGHSAGTVAPVIPPVRSRDGTTQSELRPASDTHPPPEALPRSPPVLQALPRAPSESPSMSPAVSAPSAAPSLARSASVVSPNPAAVSPSNVSSVPSTRHQSCNQSPASARVTSLPSLPRVQQPVQAHESPASATSTVPPSTLFSSSHRNHSPAFVASASASSLHLHSSHAPSLNQSPASDESTLLPALETPPAEQARPQQSAHQQALFTPSPSPLLPPSQQPTYVPSPTRVTEILTPSPSVPASLGQKSPASTALTPSRSPEAASSRQASSYATQTAHTDALPVSVFDPFSQAPVTGTPSTPLTPSKSPQNVSQVLTSSYQAPELTQAAAAIAVSVPLPADQCFRDSVRVDSRTLKTSGLPHSQATSAKLSVSSSTKRRKKPGEEPAAKWRKKNETTTGLEPRESDHEDSVLVTSDGTRPNTSIDHDQGQTAEDMLKQKLLETKACVSGTSDLPTSTKTDRKAREAASSMKSNIGAVKEAAPQYVTETIQVHDSDSAPLLEVDLNNAQSMFQPASSAVRPPPLSHVSSQATIHDSQSEFIRYRLPARPPRRGGRPQRRDQMGQRQVPIVIPVMSSQDSPICIPSSSYNPESQSSVLSSVRTASSYYEKNNSLGSTDTLGDEEVKYEGEVKDEPGLRSELVEKLPKTQEVSDQNTDRSLESQTPGSRRTIETLGAGSASNKKEKEKQGREHGDMVGSQQSGENKRKMQVDMSMRNVKYPNDEEQQKQKQKQEKGNISTDREGLNDSRSANSQSGHRSEDKNGRHSEGEMTEPMPTTEQKRSKSEFSSAASRSSDAFERAGHFARLSSKLGAVRGSEARVAVKQAMGLTQESPRQKKDQKGLCIQEITGVHNPRRATSAHRRSRSPSRTSSPNISRRKGFQELPSALLRGAPRSAPRDSSHNDDASHEPHTLNLFSPVLHEPLYVEETTMGSATPAETHQREGKSQSESFAENTRREPRRKSRDLARQEESDSLKWNIQEQLEPSQGSAHELSRARPGSQTGESQTTNLFSQIPGDPDNNHHREYLKSAQQSSPHGTSYQSSSHTQDVEDTRRRSSRGAVSVEPRVTQKSQKSSSVEASALFSQLPQEPQIIASTKSHDRKSSSPSASAQSRSRHERNCSEDLTPPVEETHELDVIGHGANAVNRAPSDAEKPEEPGRGYMEKENSQTQSQEKDFGESNSSHLLFSQFPSDEPAESTQKSTYRGISRTKRTDSQRLGGSLEQECNPKKRSRADDSQRSDSLKGALNNPSSSSSKKPPKRTKRKKLAQEEQGRSDEPSQTGVSAKLKSPTPSEFEKDSRTLCGTPEWIPGFESTNRNIRRYQNSPAFRRERQKEMKESLIRRHCIEPFLTQAVEASEDGNIYHAMEKVEELLTEAYQQKLIERESAYLSDEQEEKPEEIENSRLSQCSGPVTKMTELDNTQASVTTKSMTGTDLEGSAFAMKIRARLARKNSGVDTA